MSLMKGLTQKTWRIGAFILFYLAEVIRANFDLAWHILSPRSKSTPGIIKRAIGLTHDNAILLLVNLISMTPGTLTIDLSDDKKYIYVHTLFVEPEHQAIKDIRKLEQKIEQLFK